MLRLSLQLRRIMTLKKHPPTCVLERHKAVVKSSLAVNEALRNRVEYYDDE